MKRYTISIFFISFVLSLFGQDEYLKNKIGNTKLKQIKDKTLVNYNLLEQTKGKVTIIEFWETWCGPCIQSMQHLKKMKEKFPNELEIICVSCDDLGKTISFIEKNKFPFTFIYDKEKYLDKQVFPHTGIPHSILVDKTGKIQARTMPHFITEQVINTLVNGGQINIPNVTFFNPDSISDKKLENALIYFELRNYQLGDRGYLKTANKNRPKRIITDYQGGYKDTTENISEGTAIGNILQLYQYAYENIPLIRFIYDRDLDYINSYLPDKRYTMIFSCSDLLGNSNTILINQLNSIFGLKTSMREKEVEVFILDSISTNTGNIKRSYDKSQAMTLFSSLSNYEIEASYMDAKAIAKTLEDFFKIPVETEISNSVFYDIEMKIQRDYIEDSTERVNTWLKLFKEHGFILRKEKKVLKFVEIEKSN